MDKIANQLKLARLRKDFTVRRLGAETGIMFSHLSLIENGKRVPRLDTFIRICEALEVKPSDLFKAANK